MKTAKQIKIEKRNELLKTINPNAINIETLGGLGVTFKRNSVRIVEDGITIERKIKQVFVHNQNINYIVK